jgi:hypothetical protein
MKDNPIQLQQQQIDGHVFGDARLEKRGLHYMKRSVKVAVPASSRLAETGPSKWRITGF